LDFKRGEILYDPNFLYPAGGETCDKLLLVVNKSHHSPDDVVVVPATTNKRGTPYQPGCNESRSEFYFDKQIGFYRATSIIQFWALDFVPCGDYEELIRKGRITQLHKSTSQEEFGRILNCLKQLKKDIPISLQELIF
jgi:hypothetical protein